MTIFKDNERFVYFLAIPLVKLLINEWCAGVFQLAGSHATPATVQVFTALLGDLCSSDAECSIPHSTCISGACICRLNYTQSSDRQNCIGTDLNGFYLFYIVFRRTGLWQTYSTYDSVLNVHFTDFKIYKMQKICWSIVKKH